jgi:hypothetical protein
VVEFKEGERAVHVYSNLLVATRLDMPAPYLVTVLHDTHPSIPYVHVIYDGIEEWSFKVDKIELEKLEDWLHPKKRDLEYRPALLLPEDSFGL